MNRFKEYALTGIGFVILTLALSSASPGLAVSAAGKEVTVDNTAANPVPTLAQGTTEVSGSVSVSNTPTVLARQDGAWNISLSGAGTVGISPSANTVKVGNEADSPVLVRDVDGPSRQPYEALLQRQMQDGDLNGQVTFLVPAGKRLMVEHISALGHFPAGQNPFFLVRAGVRQPLLPASQFPGGSWVISQPIKLFADADPNRGVTVLFSRIGGATGIAAVEVIVSGYLVDLP